MGDDTARLAVAIEAAGITYQATRHESVAVGMADGYARVSGELGVALVSRGPGTTNALSAIATAAKAGSRVLVLTGASPEQDRGIRYSKFADQSLLYQGVGVDY